MAKDPAFLFYPNDFIGGTMGFTLEEKGAYLELLIMQWQCHRITNDKAKRILGDAYTRVWPILKDKFTQDENGDWYNERLDLEIEKRRAHGEKQRENANKRWNKNTDATAMPPHCNGNAMAMPLGNENENENENENRNRKGGAGGKTKKPDPPVMYPWDDPEFLTAWEAWKKYKREQFGFKYKPSGEQSALMSLAELSGGAQDKALAIIRQSMANGWKGFFELKINGNGKQQNGTNWENRKLEANQAFNDFWAERERAGH